MFKGKAFKTGAALALGVGSFLVSPEVVSATQPGTEAKISHETPTSADLAVNTGTKYSVITKVCARLAFNAANKLDPDEGYELEGWGGAVNAGTTSLSERETCAEPLYQPEIVNDFMDGKAKLGFAMYAGTVDLESVQVRVEGTPAK